MTFKKVTIIIPVFNERDSILKIVKKVRHAKVHGLEKELIIVDDGSVDGTANKLRRLKVGENLRVIFCPKNGGKGKAILEGLKVASGDIIIPQDADTEQDPGDFEKLLKPIIYDGKLVVFGTRFARGYPRDLPWFSKVANWMVTLLANVAYQSNISDEACGYKVMPRSLYSALGLKSHRFDICPETLAKLRKKNIDIHEVPVSFKCRSYKEGKKIHWSDGIMAIVSLIKFRFID